MPLPCEHRAKGRSRFTNDYQSIHLSRDHEVAAMADLSSGSCALSALISWS
jgi:hypothetical protein